MLELILYNTFNNKIPYDICRHISSYSTKHISYLPIDILTIIISFIPYHQKFTLNRWHFDQYHHRINLSEIYSYESYLRNVIRNNRYFILNNLLLNNIHSWTKKKKYLYKKMKCDSFIELLNLWSIQYRSNKCREVINTYIDLYV